MAIQVGFINPPPGGMVVPAAHDLRERLLASALRACRDLQQPGRVHAARANQHQAQELYRRALDIQNHLLGPNHPDVAASLSNVAMRAARQGDVDRARDLFETRGGNPRIALGAEHPQTVTSRTELAALRELSCTFAPASQAGQALGFDAVRARRRPQHHCSSQIDGK